MALAVPTTTTIGNPGPDPGSPGSTQYPPGTSGVPVARPEKIPHMAGLHIDPVTGFKTIDGPFAGHPQLLTHLQNLWNQFHPGQTWAPPSWITPAMQSHMGAGWGPIGGTTPPPPPPPVGDGSNPATSPIIPWVFQG